MTEPFLLTESREGADPVTRLEYQGQLGTDLWALGAQWGRLVASRWEAAVADTFAAVKAEAERRAP